MIRYITAGESHGKMLTAIIEGFPAGLTVREDIINNELKKRQSGYGRGARMEIEQDKIEIVSGIIGGKTIGSPITLCIYNKDWQPLEKIEKRTTPRPGHADLSGLLKYGFDDITPVLERASARETAIRTAVGAFARQLLIHFGIRALSCVTEIGGISVDNAVFSDEQMNIIETSLLRCPDKEKEEEMIFRIDEAKNHGETLGGRIKITVKGCPPGLGSYVQYDRKLDARLAMHLMSIQAVKGIEIGEGFNFSRIYGSEAADEIYYNSGIRRRTNHCGGIEGGMSNGEDIIINIVMKPIPTLQKPLNTIDIISKNAAKASKIRSDVCAVPAASIVAENIVCWVIAECFLEKFGGDSMEEVEKSYKEYIKNIKR